MLTMPRPRGQGKRRMERGGGSTKRPRMDESSSERRDESEESRSGGARDRPGRGGRRTARPMTPPHRPPPPSISPLRSPRLTQSSAARELRNLRKPTGGRPTLDRLVEMSTDGDRAARRGVHQTTDGRARAGGIYQGNLRRRS